PRGARRSAPGGGQRGAALAGAGGPRRGRGARLRGRDPDDPRRRTTRSRSTAVTGPAGDALVLFGITGDLSRKMILPALYRLAERGQLTVPVIGVSRSAGDPDEVRKL